jgi:hypothetical protein
MTGQIAGVHYNAFSNGMQRLDLNQGICGAIRALVETS